MWHVDRTHGDVFSKVPKLGPGVTSSLPPPPEEIPGPPLKLDVDEGQNLNSRYVLSGKQRAYARTGIGSDSSELNSSILEKRDLLPERIQQLIDDAAVLYSSPYLSAKSWESGHVDRQQKRSKFSEFHRRLRASDSNEEGVSFEDVDEVEVDHYQSQFDSPVELWEEFIDVSQRSQQVRDDVFFHGDSVFPKEAQFGFELGSLLRMLRPEYGDDPPGMDLIWGFILAFIGNPQNDVDQEQESLNELVDHLESRFESRLQEAEQMPTPDEIKNIEPEFHDATVAAIEEKGLTPHRILVREVLYHQPPHVDNETIHKRAVKGVVDDVVDIVPLRDVDDLETILSEDIETIQDKTPAGLDSLQRALTVAWEHVGEPREETDDGDFERSEEGWREELQNSIGTTGAQNDDEIGFNRLVYSEKQSSEIAGAGDWDVSQLNRAFHRLTDDHESELWTTVPLFEKVEGSGDNIAWQFTAYGALLVYIVDEYSGDMGLLYWYALGPEELSMFERQLILNSLDFLGFID